MGVMIFRDNNWDRLKVGIVSGGDILRLDREKDKHLIDWLILNLNESKRKTAMRRYRIMELPEEMVNIDDPDDEVYRTYYVLREQVMRENDAEVLKKAAFGNCRNDISRFAFCRLTGFSWPPDECDAYSYRTYRCGLKSGVTRKEIEDICREMIEQDGLYAEAARKWLLRLPEISDAQLAEWSSGDTERKAKQREDREG